VRHIPDTACRDHPVINNPFRYRRHLIMCSAGEDVKAIVFGAGKAGDRSTSTAIWTLRWASIGTGW